jgi:hypothetical protein
MDRALPQSASGCRYTRSNKSPNPRLLVLGRSYSAIIQRYREILAVIAVTMTVVIRAYPVVMIVVRMSDHDDRLRACCRNEWRHKTN